MKNTSAIFFTTILAFAISTTVLWAQDAISTNGSGNNVGITMQQPQAATNAAATTNSTNRKTSDNSVSINAAGIHVGGGNGVPPVDINWGNERDRSRMDTVRLAAVLSPFIFSFVLPVTIIVIIIFSKHRRNKMMHETIRAMIEKGMPVHPELIAQLGRQPGSNSPRPRRSRNLLSGLILTGIGVALIGIHPSHSGKGGWILLFVGVAFLIVWLVDKNQNGDYDRNLHMTGRQPDNDQQPPKM